MKNIILTTIVALLAFTACKKEKQSVYPEPAPVVSEKKYDSLNGSTIHFRKDQTIIYKNISHDYIHIWLDYEGAVLGNTVVIQSPIKNIRSFVFVDTNYNLVFTNQPTAIQANHVTLNTKITYLGTDASNGKHIISMDLLPY